MNPHCGHWPKPGSCGWPKLPSRITIDGVELEAIAGESLAAALVRAGQLAQRMGRSGEPHGHFCGMGVCYECVVEIDGLPGHRACMTKVRHGMTVRRQAYLAAATPELPGVALPDANPVDTPEIMVIGAGPAGLEAALAARTAGAEVLLVDERAAAGGQLFKQVTPNAADPHPAPRDRQMARGRALVRAVIESGVRYLPGAFAWTASLGEDGAIEIGLLVDGRPSICRPGALIVATGATERPYPVPGWTLPGVMTCGGMQTLVRSAGTVPPGPVVVAGNGPLNLQLACELIDAGAEVAALVESAPAPHLRTLDAAAALGAAPALMARGAAMLLKLRRHGVPTHFRHAVRYIVGDWSVESVSIAPVGADGGLAVGKTRRMTATAVALGYGFLPENGLLRLLGVDMDWQRDDLGSARVIRDKQFQTSIANVYVVGEANTFGGGHVAMMEGRIAGAAAAAARGYPDSHPSRTKSIHRKLARHRRFQRAIWRVFASGRSPLAGLTDDTIVCRCEDVTAGDIRAASALAGSALGAVKRLSRAGMGRCQGRFCGAVVRRILAEDKPATPLDLAAPQSPVKPVRVAELALEKGEWGGHRRVVLPAPVKPGENITAEPLPDIRCDAVVVGGGVIGTSTARCLALAGLDVVVVEASHINGQASGSNAGSLHVQLLSFDLGEKAEAGGLPALRTLPLQQASVRLWEKLAGELGTEIGFARGGGLMVADDDQQMRFLERKAALERSVGIDSTVIGAAEARRVLPALSDHIAGALWCPEEGKINPLLATPAIADAAKSAGARLVSRCMVRSIEPAADEWLVRTSRLNLTARHIVNAAGPWASTIGGFFGAKLPVYAAPLQMIVTEPAAAMMKVLLSHADRHLTLKQAENGNFLIGGGWPADLSARHAHPRPMRESIEGNLWVAQHVLPILRGLNVIRTWSAMNINIDGAPILGELPGASGVFNAVMSGGYTLAPVAAEITCDLITKGRSDHDITPFSVSRFS